MRRGGEKRWVEIPHRGRTNPKKIATTTTLHLGFPDRELGASWRKEERQTPDNCPRNSGVVLNTFGQYSRQDSGACQNWQEPDRTGKSDRGFQRQRRTHAWERWIQKGRGTNRQNKGGCTRYVVKIKGEKDKDFSDKHGKFIKRFQPKRGKGG